MSTKKWLSLSVALALAVISAWPALAIPAGGQAGVQHVVPSDANGNPLPTPSPLPVSLPPPISIVFTLAGGTTGDMTATPTAAPVNVVNYDQATCAADSLPSGGATWTWEETLASSSVGGTWLAPIGYSTTINTPTPFANWSGFGGFYIPLGGTYFKMTVTGSTGTGTLQITCTLRAHYFPSQMVVNAQGSSSLGAALSGFPLNTAMAYFPNRTTNVTTTSRGSMNFPGSKDGALGVGRLPTTDPLFAVSPQYSTALEACHAFTSAAGTVSGANINTIMVHNYDTSDHLLELFNSTAAPADGAVTPQAWERVPAGQDVTWPPAGYAGVTPNFNNGVVACLSNSTTAPFTKAAVTEATYTGLVY